MILARSMWICFFYRIWKGDNCSLEMIAGGCDADCHRRRFKTKLIAMAMSGYDRVIIEPSGIYDVDEIFDALYEEPLDRFYEPGNVIALVDAGLEEDLSKRRNICWRLKWQMQAVSFSVSVMKCRKSS